MDHDLVAEGEAFRLRPVRVEDAEFIVSIRTDPELGRFLYATARDASAQRRWIEQYLERVGDDYFIIERLATGEREGTIALYEIDGGRRRAEWGRWVVRKGSMAALESASLIYRVAFEQLGLDEVYCRTTAENVGTVSFHESCGLETVGRLDVEIGGVLVHAVEHRLRRANWPPCRELLAARAHAVARMLRR